MTKSLFNTQLVSSSFGWTNLTKARLLCETSAVLDWGFDISGTKLVGRVQDGKKSPYKVEVVFSAPDETGKSWLTAKCSCSSARDCVHAAAVALRAAQENCADDGAFTSPQIDSEGLRLLDKNREKYPKYAAFWLNRLDAALLDAALSSAEVSSEIEKKSSENIIYCLTLNERLNGELQIEPRIAKRLKSGEFGTSRSYNWLQLATSQATFVTEPDRVIARLWATCCHSDSLIAPSQTTYSPADGAVLDLLIKRILATERAYLGEQTERPLLLGQPLQGSISWIVHDDSRQSPQVVLHDKKHCSVINCSSFWYYNSQTEELGTIVLPYSQEICQLILSAPRIAAKNATEIYQILSSKRLDLPLPQLDIEEELCTKSPQIKLTLRFENLQYSRLVSEGAKEKSVRGVNLARLQFDYGFDSSKLAESWESYRWSDGKRFVISKRDLIFEQSARDRLANFGFKQQLSAKGRPTESSWIAKGNDTETWLSFIKQSVPALEKEGWQFEYEDSFQYKVIECDQDWLLDVSEPDKSGSSSFWFSLDLGILVEGVRLSLLPIISQAINSAKQNLELSSLDSLNFGGKFYAHLDDGRLIALPFERVRNLVACLAELLDKTNLEKDGRLNVSLSQLSSIKSAGHSDAYHWKPESATLNLVEQISQFDRKRELEEPEGLNTSLRTYQKEGLAWLDFISSFNFGGILADDMGLGKTVQILAHIAREKQLGRLQYSCLVICPTSVMPNWQAEIRRLAPSLSVIALHGSSRSELLRIAQCVDIVLTTYPILTRDIDSLSERKWHCIVLDEAQAIKNDSTQAAQAVLRLECNHRISLTGTPIENHIGELWSQFNFLMPGLLGKKATFDRVFRSPIEKDNDKERMQLLLTRIQPFLIRRTKTQVAKDLPAKTEMIKYIEVEGKQRDLYETVRLSMHEQVLEEIKAKGIASCGLVILDALMKLRQTCCHTNLVKLDAASNVNESAKLKFLMEMLGDLVEEKRQVLIFSQFTGMLDLIAAELSTQAIEFVQLRGSTKDRVTPVERFQRGEVPVFLISLKAGGTGLNLTAADTVIHFDPWWNPAVEDQATDRAYRIGQDKPVFVYRLIAEGTIEERMLELQSEKRAIANSILADEDMQLNSALKFDEDTLAKLFAPLK
ncbi:MAG: DEAD/DEAH box helicase [Candidatus Melainabacteria bacterium]|nr:DEAD/DEAH box helicase [Candidatus Melainabacteria bacterium]